MRPLSKVMRVCYPISMGTLREMLPPRKLRKRQVDPPACEVASATVVSTLDILQTTLTRLLMRGYPQVKVPEFMICMNIWDGAPGRCRQHNTEA